MFKNIIGLTNLIIVFIIYMNMYSLINIKVVKIIGVIFIKKLVYTITFAVGLISLSACSGGSTNSDFVVESKAGNITKDELYNAMKEKFGQQTLQEIVFEKVLSEKYKITNEELELKVKEIKDQAGENFEMLLAQNNMKDEEELKEILRKQLLIEKAALKEIEVTEKELKDYYDKYKPEIRARHILVEDENTAKEVKEKLSTGANFEDLAKEYSKDPGSAENGGDLGWFGAGKMAPEFEAAAYALKINEISNPVKTQSGFHIIQVMEQKEKDTFEKMKGEIENKVKISKIDSSMVQEVMQKELKAANVEIKDKDLKGIFEENNNK